MAAAVEYTNCIFAEGWDPPWVSWYDIKQTDGEAPVMLELWGMQSSPLLPSLQGLLQPGVVATDKVLSMRQTELFDIQAKCKQMASTKLNYKK